MARILVAVSSVGLGHAARARVYGSLLQAMGHLVEYYAPEPAGSYIRAWGGRVIPYSLEVESLSVHLERHWERSGSGLIGLRAALEEYRAAREAGLGLVESVDLEGYDLVVAEEAWEVISVAERIGVPKAWVADFVGYRPSGMRRLAAAWAVNRFLLRRYRFFDALFYVGLPGDLGWRMTPMGPTAASVLENLFDHIGPIPAFTPWERMGRGEARARLGLPHDDRMVLVQLGGTRAGAEVVEEAARAALDLGLTPVVARGPRARPRLPHGALDIGYQPLLPAMLGAFDCAYVLAGLSTIASLAAAGVPAVVRPLPGHFEQEENASKAPRIWPGLFVRASRDPARDLEAACSRSPGGADGSLHGNPSKLARRLETLLAGSPGHC